MILEYSLAKELNKIGYNVPNKSFDDFYKYRDGSQIRTNQAWLDHWAETSEIIECPTAEQVKQWFRDNHFLHLDVNRYEDEWKFEVYEFKSGNKHIPSGFKTYPDYEQALKKGIWFLVSYLSKKE